jgi:hypothetical protein
VNVERACRALLIAESSGAVTVAINEKTVYQIPDLGDQSAAVPDVARCELMKGRNRILVLSRQGADPWFYRIQIAPLGPPQEPAVATAKKD